MADTTPRLTSTPVDPRSDYSPLSWMAAAAFGVALVFALSMLFLGYFAFRESKPLIEPWLFAFPVFGIVLAFAARRHIRNSEQTRSGLEWATRAWWICIVGGLSYAAYLWATEYTIRSETEKQFLVWGENLKNADLAAANDPALSAAFYQTLPPNQRVAFTASHTTVMQDRFGPDFTTFRQNNLLTMVQRNPGRCELIPQGLRQWQQLPGKIECALAATLKTPEGEFPIILPMEATVEKGKREWQIKAFDGFVQDMPGMRRTPYGWLVQWLDESAKETAQQFLRSAAHIVYIDGVPVPLPDVAFDAYCAHSLPKPTAAALVGSAFGRVEILGALGLVWPVSPAYARALKPDGGFFVRTSLPDGKLAPEGDFGDFLACWYNISNGSITPAGRILSNSTERHTRIRFYDDRVEIAVPIELKVPRSDPKNSAALGRLVLTLDDREILAELSAARELGLKGEATAVPKELPKAFQHGTSWKVSRIESNLKVIRAPQETGPPGSGPG